MVDLPGESAIQRHSEHGVPNFLVHLEPSARRIVEGAIEDRQDQGTEPVTDITDSQPFDASGPVREADKPFLRRILFVLIAATLLTGAVTVTLTSQQGLVELIQVASTHGPA